MSLGKLITYRGQDSRSLLWGVTEVMYTKHNINGVKYIFPKEEIILLPLLLVLRTVLVIEPPETIGTMVAKTDKNDW